MTGSNNAQQKFESMPVHIQHAYGVAWNEAEKKVESFYLDEKKKKGATVLVYHVHHGIANARKLFQTALLAGKSPAQCKEEAVSPYAM